MNKRQARRLATRKVAAAARRLAEDVDCSELPSEADADRMAAALCEIAFELERRAGLRSHGNVPRTPDPDQYTLFNMENEEPPL